MPGSTTARAYGHALSCPWYESGIGAPDAGLVRLMAGPHSRRRLACCLAGSCPRLGADALGSLHC